MAALCVGHAFSDISTSTVPKVTYAPRLGWRRPGPDAVGRFGPVRAGRGAGRRGPAAQRPPPSRQPPRRRHNGRVAEFLIITGMSGAGRSQAGATLEDLGWFVIDNMPTALITKVAELIAAPGSTTDRVALVVGRDAEQLDELEAAVHQLRAGGSVVRTLFLEASDEVLVRRFEGTRRRHPLGQEGVTEAIALERKRLEPIRALADVVVDTTDLNVNQLRERLHRPLHRRPERSDADLGHVVRLQARGAAGRRQRVRRPLPAQPPLDRGAATPDRTGRAGPQLRALPAGGREFVRKVDDLLGFLLPAYVKEGKSYLTVAVGCTGGRHRSVSLVEELAARIRSRGYDPVVYHRDLDR